MIIATFNINGVNGRLPILLRWLKEARQTSPASRKLKAPDERFPAAALAQAGYGAVWHGQMAYNGVAILTRGCKPQELRRGLPGDPNDDASRYI
jgi:exodeoxyribonuclease-3